jgi:SOS response regulatory protein OraA/RecX
MLNPDKITITKASGQSAVFDPQKLKHSLLRSGASAEQIQTILGKIEDRLYPGITTKKIYQAAFKLLRRQSRPVAARYKLKSAIMELGPSGFPFEKYIAAILQQHGYQTQTGVLVQGKCVQHEVDVIAQKGEYHVMIECKYHNQPGTVCNVKIPLYIQSRFKDVEASWMKLTGHELLLHQGWVVTNTKFTTDAIQYGTCAGLHEQIERSGLYPITCLTTLSKTEKQILLNNKTVLCREVCDSPALLKQAGVSEQRIKKILEEGQLLCQKKIGDGTHS